MKSSLSACDVPVPVTRGRRALAESTISRDGVSLLDALEARTFLARLRGLHATGPLSARQALVIRPCRAIHTWWLGYPIDVVFMDAGGVIRKVQTVRARRVAWCRQACVVLEMAAGTADRLRIRPGQVLTGSAGGWL